MILSYYTDVGRVRKENQDSIFARKIGGDSALLIVADGMGGHSGGRTASMIAVEEISRKILSECGTTLNDDTAEDILRTAVASANAIIYTLSVEDASLNGMGTTVVAALIYGGRICAANVGDSRLYIVSDGVLTQVTRDHSYVESLVSKGVISKAEAKTHPKKNIITRAVGTDDSVDIDIFKNTLGDGDTVFMCTDGLYGEVSEDEILSELTRDPFGAPQALAQIANRNGGRDNISSIAVKLN